MNWLYFKLSLGWLHEWAKGVGKQSISSLVVCVFGTSGWWLSSPVPTLQQIWEINFFIKLCLTITILSSVAFASVLVVRGVATKQWLAWLIIAAGYFLCMPQIFRWLGEWMIIGYTHSIWNEMKITFAMMITLTLQQIVLVCVITSQVTLQSHAKGNEDKQNSITEKIRLLNTEKKLRQTVQKKLGARTVRKI